MRAGPVRGGGWEAYGGVGKGGGTDCTWACWGGLKVQDCLSDLRFGFVLIHVLFSGWLSFLDLSSDLRLDGNVFVKVVCVRLVAE